MSRALDVYLKHPATQLHMSLGWKVSEGDPRTLSVSRFQCEYKPTALSHVGSWSSTTGVVCASTSSRLDLRALTELGPRHQIQLRSWLTTYLLAVTHGGGSSLNVSLNL